MIINKLNSFKAKVYALDDSSIEALHPSIGRKFPLPNAEDLWLFIQASAVFS